MFRLLAMFALTCALPLPGRAAVDLAALWDIQDTRRAAKPPCTMRSETMLRARGRAGRIAADPVAVGARERSAGGATGLHQ
jgi:hypothetical protein